MFFLAMHKSPVPVCEHSWNPAKLDYLYLTLINMNYLRTLLTGLKLNATTKLQVIIISNVCYSLYLGQPISDSIHLQTFSRTQLKLIGITASNTWGLLLLVFLMGYGLVEVPRTVWRASNLEYQLAHVYFKVSKMSTEKEEAEEKLHEVLTVSGYLR